MDARSTPEQHPVDFTDAVHQLARMIPPGRVLSYGDIAELLGSGGPRQVGKAMQHTDDTIPWWRVIRSNGSITEALAEQAANHWRQERTAMRGSTVQMSQARWKPSDTQWQGIDALAADLRRRKLSAENDGIEA